MHTLNLMLVYPSNNFQCVGILVVGHLSCRSIDSDPIYIYLYLDSLITIVYIILLKFHINIKINLRVFGICKKKNNFR